VTGLVVLVLLTLVTSEEEEDEDEETFVGKVLRFFDGSFTVAEVEFIAVFFPPAWSPAGRSGLSFPSEGACRATTSAPRDVCVGIMFVVEGEIKGYGDGYGTVNDDGTGGCRCCFGGLATMTTSDDPGKLYDFFVDIFVVVDEELSGAGRVFTFALLNKRSMRSLVTSPSTARRLRSAFVCDQTANSASCSGVNTYCDNCAIPLKIVVTFTSYCRRIPSRSTIIVLSFCKDSSRARIESRFWTAKLEMACR